MKKYLCMIACALAAQASFADPLKATCVESTIFDSVGSVVEYRLKNELRRSPIFRLVERCEDANFLLSLKTLDPGDPPQNGNQTVYSLVFSVRFDTKDSFVYGSSTVGICGSKRTEECASRMMAFVDQNYSIIKKAAEDFMANSKNIR